MPYNPLINNASALLRLRDILDDNDVSYGVRGGLYTQGAFGTKKLKVEKTGRLDLKDSNPLETDWPDINDAPPSG